MLLLPPLLALQLFQVGHGLLCGPDVLGEGGVSGPARGQKVVDYAATAQHVPAPAQLDTSQSEAVGSVVLALRGGKLGGPGKQALAASSSSTVATAG